jgi:glycosyltransferase involved in cell wall biosynthesis
MRIGIDATCWQNTRGYGRHARALLSALVDCFPDHRYTFFMDSLDGAASVPAAAECRLLRANVPAALAASAHGRRSVGDMWRMSRALSAADVDVVLFPTVYSYVPVFTRAKKVVFIHDVIAEMYPHLTLPKLSARWFWKTKVAAGRAQADAIVTVSDYSRAAILRHFQLPAERVFVVGEACDPVFTVVDRGVAETRVRALGIDPKRRLLTYVGGFGPHKNLGELVTAFARLAARPGFSDILLLMVGEYRREVFHSYISDIRTLVDRLGIGSRVVFTGYLSDPDVVGLLNVSTLLALPSLMEGFGLPAVEAAACGCPVIATTASPLPGLLGDGGIYIEPGTGQLEQGLELLLTSPAIREQMRQAGIASAGKLSWDAAASQLMHVMRAVAQHGTEAALCSR